MELEDVFRSFQRPVFAYFLRVVGNPADAEELTQETFVRACTAALRFRGDSSVKTWLFGIARRVMLEAARGGIFDGRPALPDHPAPADAPDERIDLERAFARLAVGDREVLMLVDVLGFEPQEAATTVGVSADTFRVRLHRARTRLREAYER